MKKLLYLAVIALFVASCSSSQFTGERMSYGHKDVEKSEITKKEKVTYETQDNVTKVAEKQEVKKSFIAQVKEQAKAVKQAKAIKKALATSDENIELAAVAEAFNAPAVLERSPGVEETTSPEKENMDKTLEIIILVALILLFPMGGSIIAVGYVNDWAIMPMVFNALWWLACGLPGLIHAIIHLLRYIR